jgi:hypothetical protein
LKKGLGDQIECGIPVGGLAANLGMQQAIGRAQGLAERRAFRTNAAAIGRVLRVAGNRAVGVGQDAATDPAIRAGRADPRR